MEIINKIEYLSQRDARWATTLMGGGNLTVGRYGCTTTCISMLTDYFKCKQSPKEIALNKNNYIKNDSNINWMTLDFPTFSFRWREGSYFSETPLDMEMIKSYMVKGTQGNPDRAVLLEVDNHSHWLLGLWPIGDDILAVDPWTKKTCEVLKEYKNITGAALFVRWDKTKNGGKQAWQGAKKPEADNNFD